MTERWTDETFSSSSCSEVIPVGESFPNSLYSTLQKRRERLAQHLKCPVLLWSGAPLSRNFPANRYSFRASSHFLYFAGVPLPDAVIYLNHGQLTLFWDEPPVADAIWHGATPSRAELADQMGAAAAFPLADLPIAAADAATLPVQNPITRAQQAQVLGRSPEHPPCHPWDEQLVDAIYQLRLVKDEGVTWLSKTFG